MLKQLLEKQLITTCQNLNDLRAGKIDDLNYYNYHQVISHRVEKYFVLKKLILRLAHEKKIELDLEEVAQENHVVVAIMSNAPLSTSIF